METGQREGARHEIERAHDERAGFSSRLFAAEKEEDPWATWVLRTLEGLRAYNSMSLTATAMQKMKSTANVSGDQTCGLSC